MSLFESEHPPKNTDNSNIKTCVITKEHTEEFKKRHETWCENPMPILPPEKTAIVWPPWLYDLVTGKTEPKDEDERLMRDSLRSEYGIK